MLLTVTALAVLQIHNRIIIMLDKLWFWNTRCESAKNLLHGVSTTSLDLPTVLASPNANCFPLHSKLERQHSKCGTLEQLVLLHIYLRNKLLIMPKHLINHSNVRINRQKYLRTIAFVLKINLQPTVHNILVLCTGDNT